MENQQKAKMNFIKLIYIFLGTISLGLGFAGIFVPGLPTTPFLILTAGLYLRSSDRLYQKVINNRYVGNYIADYQINKSLPLKTKLYSIGMMWIMIFISGYFFISRLWIQILLAILGVIGTIVMGFIIKTRGKTV